MLNDRPCKTPSGNRNEFRAHGNLSRRNRMTRRRRLADSSATMRGETTCISSPVIDAWGHVQMPILMQLYARSRCSNGSTYYLRFTELDALCLLVLSSARENN